MSNYPQSYNLIDWDPGNDNGQSGLVDLTLTNVDTTGEVVATVSGANQSDIFIKNCKFNFNKGAHGIRLENILKLEVIDSEFNQSIQSTGGQDFVGAHYYRIANNTFRHAFGGIGIEESEEGVFEGNQELRDGSANNPGSNVDITHELSIAFTVNIAVMNNLYQALNGPAEDNGDGETILSEYSGNSRLGEDAGIVGAATGNTLTLTATSTFTLNSPQYWIGQWRPVVAIISGPGTGQVRTIGALNGHVVTLDEAGKPWDIVPTAASRYAIFNWGSRNILIKGNTLKDNVSGIQFAYTANQVAIVNNYLNNNGGILFLAVQVQNDAGVSQEFLPTYDNQIVGNTVENSDKLPNHPSFIGSVAIQHIQRETLGPLVIGSDVRGNTLIANNPNLPGMPPQQIPEGYLNYLQYESDGTPAAYYNDMDVPAVLGSIYQDNVATNTDFALWLNTGSYDTFVCANLINNVANPLSDIVLPGTTHASVGTSQCLQGGVHPQSSK